MEYTTRHSARLVLPDGRLARARLDGTNISFEYQRWHIHPTLIRSLDEFSQHMADAAVFDLDPACLGCPPSWSVWFDRGPLLLPLSVDTRLIGGVIEMEVRCPRHLITPELTRELNDDVLPWVLGALKPTGPSMGSRRSRPA